MRVLFLSEAMGPPCVAGSFNGSQSGVENSGKSESGGMGRCTHIAAAGTFFADKSDTTGSRASIFQ